jgi:hypothetical protein
LSAKRRSGDVVTSGPTCGVDGCASRCHDPANTTGRYCAPTRCYCGECPSFVPIDRPGTLTQAEWEERRARRIDEARQAARSSTVAEARVERDEAMGRAAAGTDPEWETQVIRAIAQLVDSGATFSSDDVWQQLDRNGVASPREPRALGPIMARMVRIGRLEHVGFTPSVRRHATPIRTFRGKADLGL